MPLLTRLCLLSPISRAIFNNPIDYSIGDATPSGAVVVTDDSGTLNFLSDCGKSPCPSVVILGGRQSGTVNAKHCKIGRQYTLINRSQSDLGVVLQQEGGRFGSKAIGRFDLATCFCSNMPSINDSDDQAFESFDLHTGILLCR